MLHSMKEMTGLTIVGTDEELGTIDQFHFDDLHWAIRYLVVDTGGWFTGRKVLIPTNALLSVDWPEETVSVNLTRQQIGDCPVAGAGAPASRQHESELYDHYGYPYYWAGPYVWGYSAYPTILADRAAEYDHPGGTGERVEEEHKRDEPQLRSGKELIGYRIQATDQRFGHVEDLLLDDRDWSIRLLVVDTRDWWPDKDVLISPKRIDRVDWDAAQIAVNITRDEVENSREFDPAYPPPVGPQNEIYHRFGMPPR